MGADPLKDAVKRMNSELPKQEPTEEVPVKEGAEAETSTDDTQADDPTYTVKYNGEEIEVPLSEMKLGYMREKDYRVKMHNVSEKAKEVDSKLSALDEKISDAETLIEIDLSYLESEEGKKLKEDDPAKFLRKVDALTKRSEKLKAHKAEKQKREQEKLKEKLKEESRLLSDKISDWLDEDVKIRETGEIVKYLVEEQGYTQEEIQNIADHRVFATAREAVKLKKIMSKDLSSKEEKKPPKSVKPGTSEKKSTKTTEQKLRDKLSQSHHMNDAAKLLRAKLFK